MLLRCPTFTDLYVIFARTFTVKIIVKFYQCTDTIYVCVFHLLWFISVKYHALHIHYLCQHDIDLSAISELSNQSIDFTKLLSAEHNAIGKQTFETVRMIHRRQWIRKQFPIYFLWFSYLWERKKDESVTKWNSHNLHSA